MITHKMMTTVVVNVSGWMDRQPKQIELLTAIAVKLTLAEPSTVTISVYPPFTIPVYSNHWSLFGVVLPS